MARVTVEDCLDKVDNRFQLVVVASKRARQIENGEEPRVKARSSAEKSTVIALREIATGAISPDEINAIELKHQTSVDFN